MVLYSNDLSSAVKINKLFWLVGFAAGLGNSTPSAGGSVDAVGVEVAAGGFSFESGVQAGALALLSLSATGSMDAGGLFDEIVVEVEFAATVPVEGVACRMRVACPQTWLARGVAGCAIVSSASVDEPSVV